MLIISRKDHESFYVGEDIKITVLGFNSPRQVKIGIDAPKEMLILREELDPEFNKLKKEYSCEKV